jgi:dsRNA-specific ribonuclease
VFEVEISVGDTVLTIGRGRSKKEAEKDAARRALDAAGEEQ